MTIGTEQASSATSMVRLAAAARWIALELLTPSGCVVEFQGVTTLRVVVSPRVPGCVSVDFELLSPSGCVVEFQGVTTLRRCLSPSARLCFS